MVRLNKTAVADSDTEMMSPPRKTVKKRAVVPQQPLSDVDMESAEETAGDDNESETADDEYVVQQIMKHKFNGEDLLFHVKWEGYPKKKDWTWEPEEHLKGGADLILKAYFKSIGGRPVQKPKVGAPMRGRQTTSKASSATPAKSAKKTPASIKTPVAKAAVVKNAVVKRPVVKSPVFKSAVSKSPVRKSAVSKSPVVKRAVSKTPVAKTPGVKSPVAKAEESDDWMPPPGDWEDLINRIVTLEKAPNSIIGYVEWSDGRKSKHDVEILNKQCPNMLLQFYEDHLIFAGRFL